MGDGKIILHSKPTLGREEEKAVIEVIRSKHIAQGKKVAQFENMMAIYPIYSFTSITDVDYISENFIEVLEKLR